MRSPLALFSGESRIARRKASLQTNNHQQPTEKNLMKKFDDPSKNTVQPVLCQAALRDLCTTLAALVFAVSLTLSTPVRGSSGPTASVSDPAGDAVFPFDLYGSALVPPYLDAVQASVTLTRGVFHFEIRMSVNIPSDADPGFTPAVNHLGGTFGLLTDPKTAGHYRFFGSKDNYEFNFLVGAVYSVQDSGVGLPLGWSAFMAGPNGFSQIPLAIHGDTLIFETSVASLGNPSSFAWAVGCECDPVLITDEHHRSVLVVDYTPDHGLMTWPPAQP